MSRLRLEKGDALVVKNVIHTIEKTVGNQFALGPISGTGNDILLTEIELREYVRRDDVDIAYDYFSDGRAQRRTRAGNRFIRDFSQNIQDRISWQVDCCTVFLEAQNNGDVTLSETSYTNFQGEFRQRLVDRAFQRQSKRQGDTPVKIRRLPSRKTLGGWLERWLSCKDPAVFLKRCGHNGQNATTLSPEAEEIIQKRIEDYLHPNRISQAQTAADVQADIRKENNRRRKNGAALLPMVSLSSVQRRINKLDKFEVCAAREGIAKAKAKYGPYGAGTEVIAPLQRVEMDEWQVDLLTLARAAKIDLTSTQIEELSRIRLWLYLVFDCATRCVLSFKLAETPNSTDAIAALRLAMRDKTPFARSFDCMSGWHQHGHILELFVDNGSAFTSLEFRNACADMGIGLSVMVAGLPKLRGHVERFFRTLATGLMPFLSGRVFGNTIERGDHPSEAECCLVEEDLVAGLITFIVDIYHNRKHRGLEWATPAATWERLTNKYGETPALSPHRIRSALGIRHSRKSGRHGIRMFGLNYHSESLARRVMAKGIEALELRIDPEDISEISCFFDKDWHALPAVKSGLKGASLDIWRQSISELRQTNLREETFHAEVIDAAIARIRQIDQRARAGRGLGSIKLTNKSLDRAEREVFLGVEIATEKGETHLPAQTFSIGDLTGEPISSPRDKRADLSDSDEDDVDWRFSDDNE